MARNVSFSLAGRTALVTGSVRGLGLEMARGLAEADARVILNGREPATLHAPNYVPRVWTFTVLRSTSRSATPRSR
jgi:NAD(P)-dependent dehydrogenase (short-subunit alcohol dehydrogenase family)